MPASRPGAPSTSLALAILLAAAIVLRLALARTVPGNFDQASYEIVQAIMREGGVVYAATDRYNYSPAWFHVLAALDAVARALQAPSAVVIRTFLTLVDVATAALLALTARAAGLPWGRAMLLFLLSPVTILITGAHGQFDNLAIAFLVAALWVQLRAGERPLTGREAGLAWGLCAAAVLVKHIVAFAPFFVLRRAFPDWRMRAVAASAALVPFVLSFAPYWGAGREGILRNVFGYSGYPGVYGLTAMVPALAQDAGVLALKAALIVAFLAGGLLFAPAYYRAHPARAALLCPLIFLVLTPGIGEQYFVLPIAFGALAPTPGFYLYGAAAGLFLLASDNNLGIDAVKALLGAHRWTIVWLAAVAWLGDEVRRAAPEHLAPPADAAGEPARP